MYKKTNEKETTIAVHLGGNEGLHERVEVRVKEDIEHHITPSRLG